MSDILSGIFYVKLPEVYRLSYNKTIHNQQSFFTSILCTETAPSIGAVFRHDVPNATQLHQARYA